MLHKQLSCTCMQAHHIAEDFNAFLLADTYFHGNSIVQSTKYILANVFVVTISCDSVFFVPFVITYIHRLKKNKMIEKMRKAFGRSFFLG